MDKYIEQSGSHVSLLTRLRNLTTAALEPQKQAAKAKAEEETRRKLVVELCVSRFKTKAEQAAREGLHKVAHVVPSEAVQGMLAFLKAEDFPGFVRFPVGNDKYEFVVSWQRDNLT